MIYQSKSGTFVSGTAAVTAAWPTHAIGDIGLLVLECAGGDTPALTTANGFSVITGSPWATGTTTLGTQLAVWWCRATSSSQASPVITDPGDHAYAGIFTFRGGVRSGNPWNAVAGGVKAGASTTATLTAVTTTVPNSLIVSIITKDLDATAAFVTSMTNANLTGLTEIHDAGTTQGGGGGIGLYTSIKVTAGDTGTTGAVVTSSINAFCQIALTPQWWKGMRSMGIIGC